ncbi:hypothetical protein JOQ06_027058, partial [Pogonophryne albipinna]
HWAGSGPDPPNGLGPLSKRTSARNWIGSAADMGQHWSSSVSIWFSAFQIRYGPAFQMRYGSTYQTRYGSVYQTTANFNFCLIFGI